MGNCCGGVAKQRHNSPTHRPPRRYRRKKNVQSLKLASQLELSHTANGERQNLSLSRTSVSDYHDCGEAFSLEGSHCGRLSSPGLVTPRSNSQEIDGFDQASSINNESEACSSPTQKSSLFEMSGCLNILDNFRSPCTSQFFDVTTVPTKRCKNKPSSGVSLRRRDMDTPFEQLRECWDLSDGSSFRIRSEDYMASKVKIHSEDAFYQFLCADVVSFGNKQPHVAQLFNLPPAAEQTGPDSGFPQLLILNIMLPTYPAQLFNSGDGPGHSLIYYFGLPKDFRPSKMENQKAVNIFRRLVQDGKEADGTSTRDRMKVIPRICNVEELAVTGPLNTAEHRLMQNYSEKPVMSKPQHYFYHGDNYLEIDVDIHSYAYLARKALTSFMHRLKEAVFELALVVQGNSTEELPEQILACGKLFKIDFMSDRPYDSFVDPTKVDSDDDSEDRLRQARAC